MVLLPSSKKKYGDEISISSNDDFSINSTSSNPSIGVNISDTTHEIMDSSCDICTKENMHRPIPPLPLKVIKMLKNNETIISHEEDQDALDENNYEQFQQYIDPDDNLDETYNNEESATTINSSDNFYIPPFKHDLVSNTENDDYDFTIATGASENHFCPMKSFLYKMNDELAEYRIRMIVYDLGFSEKQVKELNQLKERGFLTELRKFNYAYYPSFFNITISRGEYAWKPAIVAEISRDYPGLILTWLDSGTFVNKSYFRRLKSELKLNKGFLSPRSSGNMRTWTHPGVYKYYNEVNQYKYNRVTNCNGASMSFDTRKAQKLIDGWYRCALVKDCIAPEGSSRINHRQDQAIITYLAAKEKKFCKNKKGDLGITSHQDRFCKKFIINFERSNNL
nr:5783_t:CDS:2 [Entrophospora candida]